MKRAFYDFAVSPFSFDFAQFLLAARATDCEQVVLVPGDRKFQKCSPVEQEFRLKNLILGLCPDAVLCQSREEAKLLWSEDCYPEGYTVETPKSGHMLGDVMRASKIFPFMATEEKAAELEADGVMDEKTVVITIRDTHIKATRNSNIEEWVKIADWLVQRGYSVLFVPDTERPDAVFGEHRASKKAALDVQYRIAVYCKAYLNMGVNNGPMALNFYSRRPLLYFRPIDDAWGETTMAAWQANHVPFNTQPPWFSHEQRVIWEGKDDFANIRDAFETWEKAKDGNAAAWPPSVAPAFPIKGVGGSDVRGVQMMQAMAEAKKNGWKQMTRKRLGEGMLSIVCYGPSLRDTWKQIKRPMMTVSGAHDFLVERGVIPDFHMDCDPRKHKAELVQRLHPEVKYRMASVVHPSFWERLAGHDVELWHLHNGPETDEWLAKHDPGANRIGGGTTAGSRALEIGSMLGYRRFEIHGMDCSFRGKHRHAGPHHGKLQNEIQVWCSGREFYSSPQMIEAAREIIMFIANYDAELWFHGDGLQQTMVEAFRNRFGVLKADKTAKEAA